MINITQQDEYGVTYCTNTFLTIEDAKDTLWQLECALDDSPTPARSYMLQDAIAQLREQIDSYEES